MNDQTKTLRIFQVLILVLVVAVVGLATWGILTTRQLNEAETTGQHREAALENEVEKDDQSMSGLSGELESSKASLADVEKKYDADETQLDTAGKKVVALRKEVEKARAAVATARKKDKAAEANAAEAVNREHEAETAERAAEARENAVKTRLVATRAQEELAAGCAKVLATGLLKIYDDPKSKTFKEVARLVGKATDRCKKYTS